MKQIIVRSFILLLLVAQIVGCGSKSVTTPTTPPVIIVPKPEFNTSGFTFSPNDSILYNTSVTIGFEVKNATSVSVDGAILKENSYATGNLTQSKDIKFIATGTDGSVVSHTVHIHVFSQNSSKWAYIGWFKMIENIKWRENNPNNPTHISISAGEVYIFNPNGTGKVTFGVDAGELAGRTFYSNWLWGDKEETQLNVGSIQDPKIWNIVFDADLKGFVCTKTEVANGATNYYRQHYRSI